MKTWSASPLDVHIAMAMRSTNGRSARTERRQECQLTAKRPYEQSSHPGSRADALESAAGQGPCRSRDRQPNACSHAVAGLHEAALQRGDGELLCAQLSPLRGSSQGSPLVGKQRLEKDMMALPPGFSTRCISLNTSIGFDR